MNPIRQLRLQAGITQQELANTAGTSQSTIAAYETGAKSPTLRTLVNLGNSLGLDMSVNYVPRLTREDLRSLAFHRAIVEALRANSAPVLNKAKRNLEKLTRMQPGAKALFERWKAWLELPLAELVSNILDLSPTAREMRQVSPFSGILNPADRVRILKHFRKEFDP